MVFFISRCMLFPTLTDEQRLAIEQFGTPCPLHDDVTGKDYVLLPVTIARRPTGLVASIPGIMAGGEGETEEEALLALRESLCAFLSAGDSFPV